MKNPQLKLTDLVHGLERFGERYEAIDVFADDVLELRSAEPVPGLSPIGDEGRLFRYAAADGPFYDIELFPDAGVVRLSRVKQPGAQGTQAGIVGMLAGGLAGAAIGNAASKKGEGAAVGLILGLLAGAALGNSVAPDAPRRVFTLRFDPSLGQWHAYDGGLVPWMKKHLLPRSAQSLAK